MVEALIFVSQRPFVIALAILGALLVTAGSLVAKPQRRGASDTRFDGSSSAGAAPPVEPPDFRSKLASHLTNSGYVITMISIALFIVAGFVSDLTP